MSLLKVNNPRSILINSPKREKNITIKKTEVELRKKSTVVIKVKNEPMEEDSKEEKEEDTDLQMPSELFSCDFIEEKSNIKEIPGEYYFESDHEALRNNPDYLSLMKTYALLQAKKIQAVKDIEDLISARTAALSQDPRRFLTKFQAEFAKLPASQNIPDVPNIDWDKYKIPSMTNELVQKPETRNSGVNKKSVQDKPENSSKEKVEGLLDCKVERNSRGQFLVRGRVFDASKPQTFNQPWTPEEQRRLEDLLLEYPSEEIEMERWKKIATCLGNRTPIQVQSRVQKYFAKLQKAGLPIPGRYRKNTPGSNSGNILEFCNPKPSTSGLLRSKIPERTLSVPIEKKTALKAECKVERTLSMALKKKTALKSALKAEHKSKGKSAAFKSECKVERKVECTLSKETTLKSALKSEHKVKGKAKRKAENKATREVECKVECKFERRTERKRKRKNDQILLL